MISHDFSFCSKVSKYDISIPSAMTWVSTSCIHVVKSPSQVTPASQESKAIHFVGKPLCCPSPICVNPWFWNLHVLVDFLWRPNLQGTKSGNPGILINHYSTLLILLFAILTWIAVPLFIVIAIVFVPYCFDPILNSDLQNGRTLMHFVRRQYINPVDRNRPKSVFARHPAIAFFGSMMRGTDRNLQNCRTSHSISISRIPKKAGTINCRTCDYV